MEPWGYSLRDLLTRARAVQLEEWDRVAAIRTEIHGIAMMLSGKRGNIRIEEFNPHRKAGTGGASGGSGDGGGRFSGMSPLKKMAEVMKAGAFLPKQLTEEQKAKVWDRLMDLREGDRAKKDAIVQMRGEVDDG